MKKFIIYNVQCVIIFASFLYISHSTLYIPAALAADSTPSADVKSKLEALKKEIASKAAKLKQEINKKLQDKAYIGIVKAKSATSITLAAKSATKMVSVNQDTLYQDTRPKAKSASLAKIKEEDRLAALGDVNDTGVLTARKVLILPATQSAQLKTVLWGQVISVSDDLISVRDQAANSVSASLASLKNAPEVKINDIIVATGVKSKSGILQVGFLEVISRLASPSATPKVATPTASPKIRR